MRLDLDGRRALVTGAGSGIGAAIVELLRTRGAAVVGVDKEDGDLSLPSTADGIVGKAAAALEGPLDLLVNCAGVYPIAALTETPVKLWDDVLNINLRAPFLVGSAFARQVDSTDPNNAVVNISSTAGLVGDAEEKIGAYVASKTGLVGLTRQMAVEWAPLGIRANAVCPGHTGCHQGRPFRRG